MTERGWAAVRLDDVPAAIRAPGRSREQELAELKQRAPEVAELWERYGAELSGRRWHDVRRFLGVTAFGVNALEAPAGQRLIFPHDEAMHGQEEIYLVVRGSARYLCAGEEGELGVGELLYARPGVHRELWALESPTQLFLIGGTPGAFRPPVWASDWRPSAE